MRPAMADWSIQSEILLTCPKGLSPFLKAEVEGLGMPVEGEGPGFVRTVGTLTDTMKLNLWLRTAHRVLYKVGRFGCRDADALYRRVRDLPWAWYLPADGFFTIQASVEHPSITDPRFAALKAKDAIVDRIRRDRGRRPDTGSSRHGAAVFLHWHGSECGIFLDTSGESLQKRGYRRVSGPAPMQETLAAACLLAAGWSGQSPLVNPMCGTGTLAIEGALMALNRPPASVRLHFAFTHLCDYSEAQFQAFRREARLAARRTPAAPIVATDRDPEAVETARRNARTAGVEQCIEFSVCDYAATPVPDGAGLAILNPDYGVRLGREEDLVPVYRGIGDFFKQRCVGYRGAVFTGSRKLSRQVGLRPDGAWTFYSGALECRLLVFDIYAECGQQK
jgi:putative N6-adenine-specific DNA methylase